MPLRVLIMPDKFKGTLSAREAAEAIARGWRQARPHDSLELLPMSDGGDGFGELMGGLLDATPQSVKTVDAAHRPCRATWWWEAKTKTAIVESARIIGLAMLPPGKFHPSDLDTFGLGEVLRAAERKGAKQILIGIGGSATNDGGFGLARGLGWEFLDRAGRSIDRWTRLAELANLRPPLPQRGARVIVAVDVQNVLLGVRGATRVYGPQKGIKPSQLAEAERNLRRLAQAVARTRRSVSRETARHRQPGSGAAGGLGFGLLAFCGARLQSGFALFARHAQLRQKLRAADLVLTGEGCIDDSSAMGKGVGALARQCRASGVPCIGLAGKVLRSGETNSIFDQTHALTDLTAEEAAKARPSFWLARLAARTGSAWPPV